MLLEYMLRGHQSVCTTHCGRVLSGNSWFDRHFPSNIIYFVLRTTDFAGESYPLAIGNYPTPNHICWQRFRCFSVTPGRACLPRVKLAAVQALLGACDASPTVLPPWGIL